MGQLEVDKSIIFFISQVAKFKPKREKSVPLTIIFVEVSLYFTIRHFEKWVQTNKDEP